MCLSFQMIVDFFLVELRMTEFSEEEIRWLLNRSPTHTMQSISRIELLHSFKCKLDSQPDSSKACDRGAFDQWVRE